MTTPGIRLKIGPFEHEIDLIEKRISLIEKKIDLIEKRFGAIEKKIGVIEKSFGAVEKKIGVIEHRIKSNACVSEWIANAMTAITQTVVRLPSGRHRSERMTDIL